MTPSEMAERNGDDLWRAFDIVETLGLGLGRPPSGREAMGAMIELPFGERPGYVHMHTALLTLYDREGGEATVQ